MDASNYAALQETFLRMVVPLRREFGVELDVPRMRQDIDYAQSIVDLAMGSLSGALQLYAAHVEFHIRTARSRNANLLDGATVPV
jgi:hypothetical protein